MLGLPAVVAYVFFPNKTPPILILFVVSADNDIFVPIIILFEPKLPNTWPLPTLYPISVELLAPVALWPALLPKKFEFDAFIPS